uniref:Uncharacterized protein n=4 Tax=Cercopithecidae TaxID=9527 RepID=A0A2K5LXF8_CERAT
MDYDCSPCQCLHHNLMRSQATTTQLSYSKIPDSQKLRYRRGHS